jgi:hypothetical protein
MPPAGITVRAHDDEETATSGCASGAVARARVKLARLTAMSP